MAKPRTKNSSTADDSVNSGRYSQTEKRKATSKAELTYNTELQPTIEPEAPHRGRGRPKRIVVANAPIVNAVEEPTPTQAIPTKRVRKDTVSCDIETQPASKRKKADNAGDKAATSRQAAEITPRDVLPDRKGRNVHPAPRKPTRRSSQEVEAEREAKKKAIEKKIQELEDAKRLLAEINVLEDIHDDIMGEENPQRLSVAMRKRQHIDLDVDSSDEESFDFRDIDEMSNSSEGEGKKPEPVRETAPKKGRKKMKVTLRKDVEDLVQAMCAEDGGQEGKKMKPTNAKLPKLDSEPKKYERSGLRKDLKVKQIEETFDPFQSGGLNDEDASSTRPSFPRTQKPQPEFRAQPAVKDLKRDYSRTNNLVQVKEEGGEDEKAPTKKTRKPKAKDTKITQATSRQSKNIATLDQPQAGLSGNYKNTSEIFVKDQRWARIFIPSLTHALYTSREPFKHFRSDSPEFLAHVQAAFNSSFVNVDFALSLNDTVTVTAYDRIKSRKSKIASNVLKHIQRFLTGYEFATPADVRGYVRWALRTGGPAYYNMPTPREWKGQDKSDPSYKAPEGFLESQFIAPIAKQYLSYASNSALSPAISRKNPPKALYTLILAAVERGFLAHKNGTFATPPQFNHDNCVKPLRDFFKNIDKVKDERWSSILQYRGLGNEDNNSDADSDILQADQSTISAFRADMYIPSSPVKP